MAEMSMVCPACQGTGSVTVEVVPCAQPGCFNHVPPGSREGRVYCSKACKQKAYRHNNPEWDARPRKGKQS